jgi:hypothetical protein
MKYIKEYKTFENNLTYDEMDLTGFDHKFIVGRWFANEEDAMEYLKKSVEEYEQLRNDGWYKGSDDVTIDDYTISKDEKDTSLKPYRLFRKPTEIESRRKEAADFLNKNSIRTGQTMFTGGVWAHSFVEYKHIDTLKRLGVAYRFRPIKEINLDPVLQKELKQVFGSVLIQQGRLRFFSLEYSFDKDYIKDLKLKVEEELNKFNSKLGTDYFISKTYTKESNDTLLAKARRLLNDDDRPVDVKYDTVEFALQRGHDEEEFLAIIPEGEKGMPKMFLPV